MPTKPPSLGEASGAFQLLHESYPLPTSRKEIVNTIDRILNQGGVQKILIQLGQPIRIDRLVKGVSAQIEELPSQDLMDAARNSEMVELETDLSAGAFECLFRGFHLISAKRKTPKYLLVHDFKILRAWLGVDQLFDVIEVFGVPTQAHLDIPEETCLLIAGEGSPDAPIVSMSVKVPINLRPKKEKKNEANRGKGA